MTLPTDMDAMAARCREYLPAEQRRMWHWSDGPSILVVKGACGWLALWRAVTREAWHYHLRIYEGQIDYPSWCPVFGHAREEFSRQEMAERLTVDRDLGKDEMLAFLLDVVDRGAAAIR